VQHPDIAVVILNWNGLHFLKQFLPEVVARSKPFRVVLADNASTDDSVSWTREHFPDMEIVINDSNGGFAKGYNDALKQIRADYYVLLNSDVEVSENWLLPLVETMKNEQVAGCQPKVHSFKNRDTFEHAGASGGFLDKYHYPFCRGRIMDHVEVDEGQYDYPSKIFWATGACLMIRSKIYWEAGGLDERFFAHMEEIDLCWKLNRAGQRVCYCGQSTIYHLGAGTLGYHSPRKTYLNFRNGLSLLFKHLDAAELWYKLPIRLGLDWLAAVVFLLKGQPLNFHAVGKAHLHFIRHYARDKRKRHIIHKQYPRYSRKTVYPGCIVFDVYVKGKKKIDPVDQ